MRGPTTPAPDDGHRDQAEPLPTPRDIRASMAAKIRNLLPREVDANGKSIDPERPNP
jgi:hypothetical protein